MINTPYNELLKKAGFNEKETSVYLSALELGTSRASIIARKSGIVRSTCYGILEELVQKGLASKTERDGLLYFNVDNPELLKKYVQSQKENLENVEREINRVLPELRNMTHQYGFKPQVEFYEGPKGVVAAMESTINDIKKMAKNNLPILIHGQTANMISDWPDFPKFAAWRAKTGVKIKMFVSEDKNEYVDPRMASIRKFHYEIKKVPEKYIYRAGTNILDEKIILFDFEKQFTIVIKNTLLAQMMRSFFEFMWDNVK